MTKRVLTIFAALLFAGCANLPPRTYSLGFTDQQGRSTNASVSFGDTRLPAKLGTGKTILPPQVE